jgi:hypothetical protein
VVTVDKGSTSTLGFASTKHAHVVGKDSYAMVSH